MSSFKRAVRENLLLRIGLCGPSGSGKSLTALKLATVIAGGKPFAVVDTERESSKFYTKADGVGVFDVAPLVAPYSPERYVALIKEAETQYPVLVIDSGTQEWDGEGGVLQLVDVYAKRNSRGGGEGNKFTAWREGDAQHKKFFDAILNCKTHIIVTFRSKQEYAQGVNEKGQKTVEKLGMSPITRQGYEYELDVVGDLDTSHTVVFNKTRCESLDGKAFNRPGRELAELLLTWANTGERATIKPAPVEKVTTTTTDASVPQRKETPPPATQPAASAEPAMSDSVEADMAALRAAGSANSTAWATALKDSRPDYWAAHYAKGAPDRARMLEVMSELAAGGAS